MTRVSLPLPRPGKVTHPVTGCAATGRSISATIREVGENEGELYIVMELVEGKSLAAMSAARGLAPESVLRYGIQVASALVRARKRTRALVRDS